MRMIIQSRLIVFSDYECGQQLQEHQKCCRQSGRLLTVKYGLPKSDVLKFLLEDNCSLVVRPSGTEPKLKIYISVSAENKEMAEEVEDEIAKTAEKWIC